MLDTYPLNVMNEGYGRSQGTKLVNLRNFQNLEQRAFSFDKVLYT